MVLDRELTIADKLSGEIGLIADVMAAAGHDFGGAVILWLSSRALRRRTVAFIRSFDGVIARAPAAPAPAEIDPDDYLADHVLVLQRSIHRDVKRLRAFGQQPLPWPVRLLDRISVRNLIAAHENLGTARLRVMEHDADRSQLLPGRFDSAEALVAAIRNDAPHQ